MTKEDGSIYKLAEQEIITLYCLIGEALCMVQHLEGAISCAITLKHDVKHPKGFNKEEANHLLEQRRSLTLGKAIGLAKENALYTEDLLNDLKNLLKERNWLAHKSIIYDQDEMYMLSSREKFFQRIKNISNEAKRLQNTIEIDLIEFSESIGMDMSNVRAEINQVLGDAFYY